MKLYINKDVEFDEFTHTYLLKSENRLLMGVTSLMKKHGLSANYGGISQDVLDRAADLGTEAHKMIEDYCDGKAVVNSPLIKSFKKLGLNICCCEYLVSDNDTIASSIDLVNQVSKNEVDIIDMKRTSDVHIEALSWQLGIYKYLFEKYNPKIKVAGCYCLHIKKGNKNNIDKDTCKPLIPICPVSKEEVMALIMAEEMGEIYDPSPKEQLGEMPNLPIPSEQLPSFIQAVEEIALLKAKIKEIEEENKAIDDALYQFLLDNNLECIDTEEYIIKLKRPYEKETLDTKALKENEPEIADRFTKTSFVKGSISVKHK